MPPTDAALPDWATYEEKASIRYVHVDTDAMYPALLAEYRDHYGNEANIPAEWREEPDGDLEPEWEECLDNLQLPAEETTAYWLEVVLQSAKLELQMVRGLEMPYVIRLHDRHEVEDEDGNVAVERHWAQADRDPGRGPEMAAGGLQGSSEARMHYKNLRGVIPA